jgi:site-specific recombinase XerD
VFHAKSFTYHVLPTLRIIRTMSSIPLAKNITGSASKQPRLFDQMKAVARMRHLSLRTERAYLDWIKRYNFFHQKRHPAEMSEEEIRAFISHLAVERRFAASTQTVALSALLFLYRDVLKRDLPYVSNIERAQNPSACRSSLHVRKCREFWNSSMARMELLPVSFTVPVCV